MNRFVSIILISSFLIAAFLGFTHFSTGQTLFACVISPNETCPSSDFLSFANYHLSAYKVFYNAIVVFCALLAVCVVSIVSILPDKNSILTLSGLCIVFDKKVSSSFISLRSYLSLFELSPSRS
jgi:hypothetical protein